MVNFEKRGVYMLEKLKNIKWGYLLIGILLLTIGISFISFNKAVIALTITIGVILTLSAAALALLAISSQDRGFAFAIKVAFAVICLVGGITTMAANKSAADVLIWIFSLILIIDASFKFNTAAMAKRYSVFGWWIMMIVSVIVIAASFYLIKFTPKDPSVSTVVLGITLIVSSLLSFFSIYFVSEYEEKEKAEYYYEFHHEMNENKDK